MQKIASLGFAYLTVHHDFKLPFDDIEGLDLIVVDMRGWASIGRHQPFQHEVGPVRLCGGCDCAILTVGGCDWWVRLVDAVGDAIKIRLFFSGWFPIESCWESKAPPSAAMFHRARPPPGHFRRKGAWHCGVFGHDKQLYWRDSALGQWRGGTRPAQVRRR